MADAVEDLGGVISQIAAIAAMTDLQRHQLLCYLVGHLSAKEPEVIDEAIADLRDKEAGRG